MGNAIKKLPEGQVTNTIKMVNNWQNDGHQQYIHSEGAVAPVCPACKMPEEHMHFLWCQQADMSKNQRHRWDDFMKKHVKLKTAGVIMHCFRVIIEGVRQDQLVISQPRFADDYIG